MLHASGEGHPPTRSAIPDGFRHYARRVRCIRAVLGPLRDLSVFSSPCVHVLTAAGVASFLHSNCTCCCTLDFLCERGVLQSTYPRRESESESVVVPFLRTAGDRLFFLGARPKREEGGGSRSTQRWGHSALSTHYRTQRSGQARPKGRVGKGREGKKGAEKKGEEGVEGKSGLPPSLAESARSLSPRTQSKQRRRRRRRRDGEESVILLPPDNPRPLRQRTHRPTQHTHTHTHTRSLLLALPLSLVRTYQEQQEQAAFRHCTRHSLLPPPTPPPHPIHHAGKSVKQTCSIQPFAVKVCAVCCRTYKSSSSRQ